MNVILKPITLNEVSYNVNLLHKALIALGFPVSENEVVQNKAGQDTLKKVRSFQAQWKVPIDESTLVNENTSLAMAQALKERGLTSASRSFTVTGVVHLKNGAVKKRQKLIAFDLDLGGFKAYRKVQSLAEIQTNKGFKFLNKAVSDNSGNYQITFYDWLYGQVERKKANLVVYAIEGEMIIGSSRVVNSEDYSASGLVRNLDIIITREDKQTEYEALMNVLNVFLEKNKTTLDEIAKSRDQLVFTAGELDVDLSRINIAANAELLTKQEKKQLSHELLYGIGRQNFRLSWAALYNKQEEEFRTAISNSMKSRIIRKFKKEDVSKFLENLRECAAQHMLDEKYGNRGNTWDIILSNALPEKNQRLSFVNALGNFKSSDFREFWNKHLPARPEFKENPGLISSLLFTQQLILVTGNHQALMKELQVNRKLTSILQLIEFEKADWSELIKKTGVPDFIEGKNDEEKMDKYFSLIQCLLNSSFPTQCIRRMLDKNELCIEKNRISTNISTFLSKNENFNFAGSRIHDFKKEIKEAAGKDFDEVRSELMKIQRVFQVSTNPEVMGVLLEKNLYSAYNIANIPLKSFIKTYAKALESEEEAFAVHQRASHISTKAEMTAAHLMEYSHGILPKSIMDNDEYKKSMKIIQDHLPNPTPNYVELFGSPDICECKHCRSVFSAAAYLVELLCFLKNSPVNSIGYTPYDILIGKTSKSGNIVVQGRRPDLIHLLLTCENTNTLIPYIDLVNEVMEYYTVHGSLNSFEGYDTGETTAEELRSTPQNSNINAYRILGNTVGQQKVVYPFTLPYHQPLDVIRAYSDHLKVSRCEAMKAMNPQPDDITKRAIEAESLKISPEEYIILTTTAFDGITTDSTALHEYFGYSNAADFTNIQDEYDADGNPRGIRVLLERTGLAYTELVELIKTMFINPHQNTLDFLEMIFSYTSINVNTLYTRLEQIESGTLDPGEDEEIEAALDAYNNANEPNITTSKFAEWVTDNFGQFRQVITLYEPDSKCVLETTGLRTIQSIYEGAPTSGIPVTNSIWPKMHRFIRLWKKLGWTMHEVDLMLDALGDVDITTQTIGKMSVVNILSETTKRPLNQLAALWGNIDTYGRKSLYKKLFLNKSLQQIDEAFKADAFGNYLQKELDENGSPITLANHQSAILAAFRITEEELNAILEVARVVDGGNPRNLIGSDILNIRNLSTIYRHVVLAKALKIRAADLCKIIDLFNASPFSIWDMQQGEFTNISPEDTYEFCKLAASTKTAGFKSSVLEYILQGTVSADSKIGLDKDKILQTAKAIHDVLAAIEQEHPDIEQENSDTPQLQLTSEILIAKLSLTFQPEIVRQFMGILEGTVSFETRTDANLNVIIPDDNSQDKVAELIAAGVAASRDEAVSFLRELSRKYSYVNGSGRLTCTGVMTDTERTVLKELENVNPGFEEAVDVLYLEPETFIRDNFNGIFSDFAGAIVMLLDHPAQAAASSLNEKIDYVYGYFLPVLKNKLRKDAITQHIAALIGLSDEATALLIANDIDVLITDLSSEGFSAAYFSDANWNTSVPERTDKKVDFSWGIEAPNEDVPANNFSVRWRAYIAAPASGEYTFMVEVEEEDEVFKLYLDNMLIHEKTSTNTTTSFKIPITLNASQMHLLVLEYAEITGNAGIKLSWKTAASALEIIPAYVVYPAAALDDFAAQVILFHRAAKFILGFKISETELNHFITYKADFGNINFKALEVGHWERIRDYMTLRNSVPQNQALLTEVFALANTTNPLPTVDNLRQLLFLSTAWDEESLTFLVNTHFNPGLDDFKNEIALKRIHEVIQIVSKTGISAETIAKWGNAETDFDNLIDTAQLIKNTVKAKHEEEDWISLAGNLSDRIRENQKQALVSYLLMQPTIQAWGAKDADSLFEYFLIDVQMGACMETSRIVQANSAIQMFVNRCLLNLESNVSNELENGVSPGAIDKDRWEWMKNYRVWEANRKVFLYPENWLEPEWRNDRSEFFKELESYLVQNDITERSVEQAFRNYLISLNEVSNLEVCGIYQENYDDGNLKYLHVFARTHNAPYKFFYRRWNEYKKWSAWEKVQVDIQNVEDGENSGVHLIPIVWKKRLLLFWPEFREVRKPVSDLEYTTGSMEDVGKDKKISQLLPDKYWEIRLAWSEYFDGKWNPKQVSKEFIEVLHVYFWPGGSGDLLPSVSGVNDLIFTPSIVSDYSPLFINVSTAMYRMIGNFKLYDIHSPIRSTSYYYTPWSESSQEINEQSVYRYFFQNRKTESESTLELSGDVYLQNLTEHKLHPVGNRSNMPLTISLENPFFFSERSRSYFVNPVDIEIRELITRPGYYPPLILIPGIIDPNVFMLSHHIPPEPVLDDYLRMERITQPTAGRTIRYSMSNGGINTPVTLDSKNSKKENIPESSAMMMSSGNPSIGVPTNSKSVLKDYWIKKASVEKAFGSVNYPVGGLIDFKVRPGKGLEFHTFYHPFSTQFVTNLNQGGLSRLSKSPGFHPGLMESDTEIDSDDGTNFENVYKPDISHGLVQKPSDFDKRTYYKENVCFDPYGANSLYNWELFFHAPLYIATRLSKNGKFEEAMKWFHFIFDPTTDDMPGAGETEISRYWKVLPFKTTPAKRLEEWFDELNKETDPSSPEYNAGSQLSRIVSQWRDNPFDPHLVASNRQLAYMKHVVIKYVENLTAWGDSLFRRFTRESVNEALQVYVIANHILGPRPEFVPKRGEIKAKSYNSLKEKLDDFSNALVQLENIFPYSSEVSICSSSTGTNLLGIGPALYFCIPANDRLLKYWNTVADRLFKIRHCQDIDGVERKLALFAPPISPEALIQALSQGLTLGSILADLSSPPPIYRFTFLIQKANEFCADVKSLGSSLLAALEKKDNEELSRLRASHETNMLELITAIKERQVLDARANKENLLKARETAEFRWQHYIDLLGNNSAPPPPSPTISATLTADSQLPVDTNIATIETDVDESLVESEESGVKLIPKEKEELEKSEKAIWWQSSSHVAKALPIILHLIPEFTVASQPFGLGINVASGGPHLARAASEAAEILQMMAGIKQYQASTASKMASYIRREQDWTLNANLAAKEIIQLDKQITLADIRIQVADKELENHKQQIENSKEVEFFLREKKFTNQELYQWMKEQLFSVYKQSYNLAYDMAGKAEKAYKYEIGTETSSFIQYGFWDNSKQGLISGEKLQLALRQLEKSYLEENRRELELTKNISLALLNPMAIIELKETGKCYVSLPEELFDLDFQGHYFRRIKSVSLSIPCIVGPYTTVNCSLRLLKNSTRINTSMGDEDYKHNQDEGLWIDDNRFRTSNVPVTSIATSIGQNDAGMFEFNFRDERYLPFEGAGVISDWMIELSTERELRQFDYSTISDVILHLKYTARETGGLFKEKAAVYIKEFLINAADLSDQPLMRMFSMRHEFSTEWYGFLHPSTGSAEQVLRFTIGKERFPFFAHDRTIVAMKIDVFAKCSQEGEYHMVLSYINHDEDIVTSPGDPADIITMPQKDNYGGLNNVSINANDAGLSLDQLDIAKEMTIKVKYNTSDNYTSLAAEPEELADMFLVFHYKLSDPA